MVQRALFSILLLFLPVTLLAIDIDGEVRIGTQHGLAKPATVQLLRDRRVVYEQFTDLDGRFEFHSVEPTKYVVRAIYGDMPETEVPVDIVGGNTRIRVPITIRPPKETVDKATTISVDRLLIPAPAIHEYDKGVKDRKAGLCDRAIPHFQKAVELAPKYGEAFNDLGNCFKTQSNFAQAESAFLRAVELNATIYPSINLADLYAIQKRFEQAQNVIETSMAKNPTEGDLWFALARIDFDQGRLKEAAAAGLEAHSRLHRTADVHLLLAKVYLAQKDYPSLVSQLETYLKENPNGAAAAEIRKNLKTLAPH